MVITLTYLRTNQTQHVIAERHDTSQPTISRIIARVTTLLADTFGPDLPTIEDLDPRETLVIDGTLVPNWTWKTHPEDYSGKHRTSGRNLQLACNLTGRLRWISDDLPGSVHDAKAIRAHAGDLLDTASDFIGHVADKGYLGLGMLTPIRRAPGQQHLEKWQQEHNQQVNSIRNIIEGCIAHLKNWKILTTDYRRPHHTHTQTITATTGLHFYRLSL